MRYGNQHLQRFFAIGKAEGASFILLLLIAMPLKYFAGIPEVVKYVGWLHGLLFILYVIQLGITAFYLKWGVVKITFGLVASLVPFGPFIFERRMKSATGPG